VREHAHRGRAPGPAARLAALILALWACLACSAATATPVAIAAAEAVRGTWDASEPPHEGWERVVLPDSWAQRWPGFDGVVWYRLAWDQPAPLAPTGLRLEYLNMAGEVRLNGSVIWRDASLVEPLSRSWNMPRYWLLAPPLLREGRNELMVRVSGLAAYQPGLGPVWRGAPGPVQAAHERDLRERRDFKLTSLALNLALGSFFILLWLLRRSEVAFGWYGLHTLLWILFAYNQVATSPWPFRDTHLYQAVDTCLLVLYSSAFMMFVLRFCGRRYPRAERAMWLLASAACVALLATPPGGIEAVRGLVTLAAALQAMLACVILVLLAWRGDRIEPRILSVAAVFYVLAGAHDLLVFFQLVDSNFYYTDITALLTTIAIATVLGWGYTRSLRRIENFNVELGQEVAQARSELGARLQQQHALEVSHARIGERLNLVRDLHDGLGGTLAGSIAAVEHSPDALSAPRLLAVLKEVRDDLRLVIDASAHAQDGEHLLADQIVPLRHRMSRLLDAHGIACDWDLVGLDGLRLGPSQTLDLLRLLQEALGNVLKHSGANRVEVRLAWQPPCLRIEVRDDGCGFTPDTARGAGMPSMEARARRLGGALRVESVPGRTVLGVDATPTPA
jgi:signal transduction histidine kinase